MMIQALEAVFDGIALHPQVPLNLEAGTRVRITVETVSPASEEQPKSFLQTAKSLRLQGEPDWSVKIDQHLYGESVSGDD